MDNLKQLQSQKTQLEKKYKVKSDQLKFEQSEVSRLKNRINDIETQIEKIKRNDKIKVSEHAILRYCERVLNIDIREVKKELERTAEQYKHLGNGAFPIEDMPCHIIFKENTVVTVT